MHVSCDNCGKTFMMPDSMAGKVGRCPSCGMTVRVPKWDMPNIPGGVALWKSILLAALAVGLVLTVVLGSLGRKRLHRRIEQLTAAQVDASSITASVSRKLDEQLREQVLAQTNRLATLEHVETLAREQNDRMDVLAGKMVTKDYVEGKLALLDDLAEVVVKVEALQEQVAALQGELKDAREQFGVGLGQVRARFDDEFAESTDRVAALEEQVRVVRDDVQQVGRDAEKANRQVADAQEHLEGLKLLERRVGALEGANVQLQAAIGRANEALKTQASALDGRLQGAETAMQDLKETLKDVRAADEGVGAKVEAVEKALRDVRAALEELKGRVSAIERRVNSLASNPDATGGD